MKLIDLGKFGKFSKATLIASRVDNPLYGTKRYQEKTQYLIPEFLEKLFRCCESEEWKSKRKQYERKKFRWSLEDIVIGLKIIDMSNNTLNKINEYRNKVLRIVN